MADVQPTYVVDASVATPWLLRLADEPFVVEADRVLQDYLAGRITLTAPVQLHYEVGHTLLRAARRRRISEPQARQELRYFEYLAIPTVNHFQLRFRGWELA